MTQANTRLTDAAPDLLAAAVELLTYVELKCEECESYRDSDHGAPPHACAIQLANDLRRAVAKAGGEVREWR
jgi:hypothetical protein